MKEDEAYSKKFEKAKLLFDQGLIKEFKELFDVVPYSVVAKRLNTNNVRFKAKLDQPLVLKLEELEAIASILDIDSLALYDLIRKSSPKVEA